MRPVLFLVLLAACTKSPAPIGPAPVDEDTEAVEEATDAQLPLVAPPSTRIDALLETTSDEEAKGCVEDADCQVTCLRDGSCCGQLCQCTNVYNSAFVAKLQAQREASCADAMCPVASCMAPTEQPVARCVESMCTVEMKPLVPPTDRAIELE